MLSDIISLWKFDASPYLYMLFQNRFNSPHTRGRGFFFGDFTLFHISPSALKFSSIDFAIALDKNVGTALPICKFLSLLDP